MKVTVDISSLIEGLEEDLRKIEEGIEEGMRLVASEIERKQLDIIDKKVGGNGTYVRTGLLESAVTIMPLEWSAGLASMTITNLASYAIYNELGTGIYADNGQGRQDGWFYPVGDGTYRFTRGLQPKHFVRDSFEAYEYKAPYIIRQSIFNKL